MSSWAGIGVGAATAALMFAAPRLLRRSKLGGGFFMRSRGLWLLSEAGLWRTGPYFRVLRQYGVTPNTYDRVAQSWYESLNGEAPGAPMREMIAKAKSLATPTTPASFIIFGAWYGIDPVALVDVDKEQIVRLIRLHRAPYYVEMVSSNDIDDELLGSLLRGEPDD